MATTARRIKAAPIEDLTAHFAEQGNAEVDWVVGEDTLTEAAQTTVGRRL